MSNFWGKEIKIAFGDMLILSFTHELASPLTCYVCLYSDDPALSDDPDNDPACEDPATVAAADSLGQACSEEAGEDVCVREVTIDPEEHETVVRRCGSSSGEFSDAEDGDCDSGGLFGSDVEVCVCGGEDLCNAGSLNAQGGAAAAAAVAVAATLAMLTNLVATP